MAPFRLAIAALLISTLAGSARAGITVTSFETLAEANGYAPLSLTEYYSEQRLTNVSPASAQASGDWTGPNANGTPATWHYVGSSQISSTTAFNANSLTVTATGSFAYQLETTADFVDPSSSTIFGPGAAANYEAFFDTDVPTAYAITAQLNQWGHVQLSSPSSFVVNQTNPTTSPLSINLSGTLPPGHYFLFIAVGLGAGNLPNGVNHFAASGSYEDVTFSVQVPEPLGTGVAVNLIGLGTMQCRRRQRGGAVVR